ncbi:hypothetical protein MBGDN05_00867 [Thermoplasmatales archaeon SCGC AB-539-N05]|nr:hypothetical protein MBGDN05_00867 [Thermoplasmatales archaeon SCGC AB-539-N05]
MGESNLWHDYFRGSRNDMTNKERSGYSIKDVLNYSDKLLKFCEQEKLDHTIFLHSLIFTTEFMIDKFNFVPKEIAEIRRQTKKLVNELSKNLSKAPD